MNGQIEAYGGSWGARHAQVQEGDHEGELAEKSMKICSLCVAVASVGPDSGFCELCGATLAQERKEFGKSESEVKENKNMLEPSGTQHVPTPKPQRPSRSNRCCLALFPNLVNSSAQLYTGKGMLGNVFPANQVDTEQTTTAT